MGQFLLTITLTSSFITCWMMMDDSLLSSSTSSKRLFIFSVVSLCDAHEHQVFRSLSGQGSPLSPKCGSQSMLGWYHLLFYTCWVYIMRMFDVGNVWVFGFILIPFTSICHTKPSCLGRIILVSLRYEDCIDPNMNSEYI